MKSLLLLLILSHCYLISFSQNVGIGTNNPKAKLHVAGNLRVDSTRSVMQTKRVAVLDSLGMLTSMDIDTFRKVMQGSVSSPVTYYSCINAQASTSTSTLQSRLALTLPPGTYLLFSNCDVFNSSVDAGARVQLNEGSSEIAYSIAYSNTGTFGSWSDMQQVSPTTATTYSLMWGSWPNGTTTYIRRARLSAIKIQ